MKIAVGADERSEELACARSDDRLGENRINRKEDYR